MQELLYVRSLTMQARECRRAVEVALPYKGYGAWNGISPSPMVLLAVVAEAVIGVSMRKQLRRQKSGDGVLSHRRCRWLGSTDQFRVQSPGVSRRRVEAWGAARVSAAMRTAPASSDPVCGTAQSLENSLPVQGLER